MLKKISILVSFVFCVLSAAPALASETRVTELRTSSYQTNLLAGISKSFNLEDAAADALLKKAVDLETDNPMACALEAMLHLLTYEMCFTLDERRKAKEAILYYSEEAVARAQKRIARYAKDDQAYLAMALAKTARAYWAIKEKKYLMLAQDTVNIWDSLEAAKAANPNNHDIDFVMGLLHYHIDHYAGMTGLLSSVFITEGNRQQGLQELQQASQKGYLLKDIAQVELATVYLNYEKQPSKALPILLELRRKFPQNYNFEFTQCVALLELRRLAEAEAMAAELEKKIASATPPYVAQLLPRYQLLMGRIHFQRAQYGRAEAYFHKAIQDKSFYNLRTTARSLLYIGMIHDLRQERKYAEDYYRRVLAADGADGVVRIEAGEYLKRPYRTNGR